jgi:hypothetical protein
MKSKLLQPIRKQPIVAETPSKPSPKKAAPGNPETRRALELWSHWLGPPAPVNARYHHCDNPPRRMNMGGSIGSINSAARVVKGAELGKSRSLLKDVLGVALHGGAEGKRSTCAIRQ